METWAGNIVGVRKYQVDGNMGRKYCRCTKISSGWEYGPRNIVGVRKYQVDENMAQKLRKYQVDENIMATEISSV
jgi:hypothetical protein